VKFDIDEILKYIEERESLNPYQRPHGPRFTDVFTFGASSLWLPGTNGWGVKLFHSEDHKEGPHEVWDAGSNCRIQRCFYRLGYAPDLRRNVKFIRRN
jgi:hypothetical protein